MSRNIKIILVSLSIGLALGVCFQVGYYLGESSDYEATTDDPYLASVEEAWDKIVEKYVENDTIDYEILSQYAIQGMLEYLDDPYCAYLDPETYQLEEDSSSGSYGGIGASIAVEDDQLVVVTVYDDTPAADAGLQADDVIMEIDGVSTEGMTSTEAVLLVRGDAGTSVTLLVQHSGATESVEITVVREEIDTPSVSYEMIDTIAYIKIEQFAEDTDEEFSEILETVTEAGATGIVLDLRDNPGGYVTTVVNIASCFITDGTILTVEYNDGSEVEYTSTDQDVTTDLPVVVLVNENSASGSEVLSGALQDYGRALIVGTTTYGKGSVNMMYDLEDGAALYITIARWLTPNGNLIEGIGITPDVVTELTGDEELQWAVDYLNGDTE